VSGAPGADTGPVTTLAAAPSPGSDASDPITASAGRAAATATARALVDSAAHVLLGKDSAVRLAFTTLVGGGHLLLEDLPGTGKTLLAKAIAASIAGTYRRVQATPDLSPGEITGSSLWDPEERRFTFVSGPVFANVVLVDELNRTSPRTQAALMEAMAEATVTVDGEQHRLPDPLFVVATQNPVEHHGTFPLPEGQLDRFALALSLGYADADAERALVRDHLAGDAVDRVRPVADVAALRAARAHARATFLAEPVLDYAVRLVRATRELPVLEVGASSRATVALVRLAQARALLDGRDFVAPEDIKALAVPVLAHRLSLRGAGADRVRGGQVVEELVRGLPVPTPTR